MKKVFGTIPFERTLVLVSVFAAAGFVFFSDASEKLRASLFEDVSSRQECPIVSGTRTFTENGVFIPPMGTSSRCPLLANVLVVGGGGKGTACRGSAAQVIAFQTSVVSSVPVVVGKSGEISKFGEVAAQAGVDDGLSEAVYKPAAFDNPLNMGRYAPSIIDGIPFNAASIDWGVMKAWGVGEPPTKSPEKCISRWSNAEEGILINNMGPSSGAKGKGFGAGGEASGDDTPNPGLQGVVFIEW